MEITGKIIAALEPREGVSKRTGNNWKSQEFVIETTDGQFPRHCVFRVFGEDRLRQFNIQVGQELTVSFDIDAHEYQGRWFNDISAWRVRKPLHLWQHKLLLRKLMCRLRRLCLKKIRLTICLSK